MTLGCLGGLFAVLSFSHSVLDSFQSMLGWTPALVEGREDFHLRLDRQDGVPFFLSLRDARSSSSDVLDEVHQPQVIETET